MSIPQCLRVTLLVLGGGLSGACTVGPDFVRPTTVTSSSYTSAVMATQTSTAGGDAQHFHAGAEIPANWWALFKSEPLDAQLRFAIDHNPTLQSAEASLRQSQDRLRAGYGVFYPHAELAAGATRERSAPLQQGLQTRSAVFNLLTLSGTLSYALDAFGAERRTVEGLQAQVDDQYYLGKAAYLTLTANVVNTLIARAAYMEELAAVAQLLALEDEQLQAADGLYQSGVGAYANVLAIRSLIAANRAQLAPLEQKVSETSHLLATLAGGLPSDPAPPAIALASMALPLDIPVSLPSQLTRQRPDILSAEANLHAASAAIGVATAAMFPSISLSATYGSAASTVNGFGDSAGRFWSLGPAVSLPLFQGGTLWYGREAARDAFVQAQASYRQVVLSAFAQVADSLDALQHDAELLQAQIDARDAAAAALALQRASYAAGMVPFSEVIVLDVQYHQALLGSLQALAQRQQDTVALFIALGGGWWNDPAATIAAQPR